MSAPDNCDDSRNHDYTSSLRTPARELSGALGTCTRSGEKLMARLKDWAIAIVAVVTLAPSALAAGGTVQPQTSGSAAADRAEAASVALQELADAQGALGVYKDDTGWVVARPSSGGAGVTSGRFSGLGIPVRVQDQGTDVATVRKLNTELEALHGTASGDFGFGYEPESGKMVVQSSAPERDFAALEKAYPGLIAFRSGTWGTTADWTNDAQPHWGGAYLQGGGWACTSGYAITDNSGHRYMVTAGHCFTNGTVTNMGTAVRPSQGDPWPYWDAELIRGHSYAGYIYDSCCSGRKVKNAGNPGVGSSYCTVGRNSGFKCGWTARVVNKTICFNDQPSCFHDLVGFTNSHGDIVQSGDSGGPFHYRYSDVTAGIRGTITGYFWDVGSFAYWSYATQYSAPANFWVMHAVIP
jgi:hypothetical protein